MLKRRFRLAVAQSAITADVRTNGHEVQQLMREAAAAGARLVQFPEGMLSGYAKEQIAAWEDVDWPAVDEELQRIQALARELRIWVVLGSAHPRAAPRRPFNSLYVISDSGDIVGRYDKRYCSHTEITRFYSAGSEPLTFEVDGVRLGCAICIEINFPELFAEYERLGVDCVLLSAYPVDQIFVTKAHALAAINAYWVTLSVPGQSASLMSSQLIGPDGYPLTPVATVGEPAHLLVGDLDPTDPALDMVLNRARPWRAQARDGAIYGRP